MHTSTEADSRWSSEFPLGFAAGDTNLQRYVGNSPTNYTDPTGLYEEDVHFYMLYFVLRARGWAHESAFEVAGWSQYVDDDEVTKPIRNFVDAHKNSHFHFWGCTGNSQTTRNPSSLRNRLRRVLVAFDRSPTSTNAALLGSYFHTFADTWSHEGFNSFWRDTNERPGNFLGGTIPNIGHGDTPEGGEAPDHPYNDVMKALEMAKNIYGLVPRGRGKHLPWHQINRDLAFAFDAARPRDGDGLSRSDRHQIMRENMQEIIRDRFGVNVEYHANEFAARPKRSDAF